ncbi:hypothetical protein P4358_26420 [Bacillus thuringiensis]|nr:hypothetical protein [Bacillus thuringiensis]
MNGLEVDGEHNMHLVLLNIENRRITMKEVSVVFDKRKEIFKNPEEFTKCIDETFEESDQN